MNIIKNVFIPERYKNYYLFPTRIVGLDITKTDIFASQIYLKGNKVTLEKFITQPIEVSGESSQERTVSALKELFSHVDSYDSLNITIPSSVAIFKTLRLPFTDYEKIKMVVAYEIEPLLPFPISEAIIDFIIIKKNETEKNAEVFVAAVQQQQINEIVALFESAQLRPNVITIDILALYWIYQQFPNFEMVNSGKGVVLLDFGPVETRLAYLYDGKISLIRTLPKGFFDIAKMVSKELNITTNQALEHILRFGLERNSDYTIENSIKNNMKSFLQELSFTLASFSQQVKTIAEPISRIILLGQGASIKGLEQFITSQIHIACEQIKTNELLHNQKIDIKQKNGGIPSEQLISLGAALTSIQEQPFNLLPEQFDTSDRSALIKHLIIVISMVAIIVISLFISTYIQTSSFNSEIYESSVEIIEELKTIQGVSETAEAEEEDMPERVSKLITQAELKVTEKEKVAADFSTINRESFLTYLYEFSKLDRDELGLTIAELNITQDRIVFKGSVKNTAAATTLRQALREAPMFGAPVPSAELDKTSFSVQIPIKHTKKRTS